ncbi:MAG: hypothetical protein WDO18_01435 [Acidobacteriota bacterium]
MRALSILTLGLCAAGLLSAQKGSEPRDAQVYNGPRVGVAMYIWTDKYTYQPNQTATLRWTVKPNNDLYPYTVFVYRQNNQTGAKSYYPNNTATVTDINGRTETQGFAPAPLAAKSKAVLLGAGGITGAVTIPSELGMHTFAVELRDYTGTRILKTSYMKISVVSSTETLTGEITSNRTLTNDTQWTISGIVTVKNGAVLTVQPGTIIYGATATSGSGSVLLISREGRLEAAGTQARPIIFTSARAFGQRQRGDWGGVLMLGKAPVNVAANISGGATCGTAGCNNPAGSFYIEGLTTNPDGLYGGTDPAHNCGTMTYTRIEYSGIQLSPNNETNSFTWAGCGTQTTAHHLQAIYGGDDAFEWFGGTMNTKYIVGGLVADDFTDFQLGTTGKVQFGIMYQSADQRGNSGIEGDNSEYDQQSNTPRSNPTFYNVTYIGSGQPGYDDPTGPALLLRRGLKGSFNNLAVMNFGPPCLELRDPATQTQADAGDLTMNGILCWKNNQVANGAATIDGQITAQYSRDYANGLKGNGAGKNFLIADPLLTRPFEYSDPDFSALFGSPVFRTGWVAPPDDGFFEPARFIGGMGDYDWTQEWTSFLQDVDIQ